MEEHVIISNLQISFDFDKNSDEERLLLHHDNISMVIFPEDDLFINLKKKKNLFIKEDKIRSSIKM